MNARCLARQLFAPPGALNTQTRHLLAQAAGSHALLLDSAATSGQSQLNRLRAVMDQYLRGPAPATEKRFLLDDPHFVEALHALAPASTRLARWDAAVAPGCLMALETGGDSLGCGRLGNVVAAILLRRVRNWCGQIELATDAYGRVHIPFSDWTLVLVDQHNGSRELWANQSLLLDLDTRSARWLLPSGSAEPLVSMPRQVFDAMFVDNRDLEGSQRVTYCQAPLRPRFERSSSLGTTRIRFEPIARDAPAARAEMTGGIVSLLLEAIEHNAPHIHLQLCQCIRTIHGFELPEYATGQIASFSVPTCPGVIGFNVTYTSHDQPRLSPYCFLWLGHELGHTLHYLIDDVAYTHGWRFLENPGDVTEVIPRYGRRLNVRTLFQIPYVHLFEWWLLMLFHERGFIGLPWQDFEETHAVGDDLRAEIEESFDHIAQYVRLTSTGQAVMTHIRQLVAEANSHWQQLFTLARH